ncbi:MAG: hypothetical protein IPK64_15555 [bacterium]|nr:hypothetical protein [bacterium]
MTTTPGHVLVLVDHPNLDLLLLPLVGELAGRGHRVEVLVVEHGRSHRLREAGVQPSTDPAAFEAFLAASGPKLFVTGADLIPQHALGVRCEMLCRAHGVPSLALEHAPFSLGHDDGFPPHLAFGADVMALVGDEDARRYAALGLDPRRLVVTGSPAFDHLAVARETSSGTHAEAVAGVTVFGQGHTWVGPHSSQRQDPQRWRAELAALYGALASRFPGAPIRVKPHPAEPAHGTDALYVDAVPPELAGRVEVLSTDSDNVPLILASSLVISFSSSVWLEARILGRTAVFFSLQPRLGRTAADIEAMGGLWLPGRTPDFAARLEPHLDRLAAEARVPRPAVGAVLDAYAGPVDGRATARVAELAERLLREGPPDVERPDLVFDDPASRPRQLRPQVGYARYVHLQALADEVMGAGVEQPVVLELAPSGSDLAAHLPLAFHFRREGLLAGGEPVLPKHGYFDVVVAPNLWAEGLPPNLALELASMLALARRRVVFSLVADAIDELQEAVANLLPADEQPDPLPRCRPSLDMLTTLCRTTGAQVQVRSIQNGASFVQALLLDHLGLDPDSLCAARRTLQAVAYPHEKREGGVRLVFTLSRQAGAAGAN